MPRFFTALLAAALFLLVPWQGSFAVSYSGNHDGVGAITVKDMGGDGLLESAFGYLVYERTLDASDSLIRERKFHWGLDLSNTPQGAGGIGGLMLIEDTDVTTSTTTLSAPVYDGHGNIIALVDGVTGAVVAQYATGPFGEPMATAGAANRQDDCPFRFSTKYLDEETGFYYYGYRYFEPETGSWLSRDPLGEEGGLNLYGFLENDPVNALDYLGLDLLNGSANWHRILLICPTNKQIIRL